jgi:hypothetical protein
MVSKPRIHQNYVRSMNVQVLFCRWLSVLFLIAKERSVELEN